jgi:UPF0755 protein
VAVVLVIELSKDDLRSTMSERRTGKGERVGSQTSPDLLPMSPAEALEPARPPRRPRGRKPGKERAMRRLSPALRVFNGLLTLLVVVLGLGGALTFWFSGELNKDGPLKETKVVVVRKGDGARDIAQRLEQEGVIASHHMFVMHYVGRSIGSTVGAKPLQLKAGEYEFPPAASLRQVADIISDGRSVLYRLSIPEGLTSASIIERLKADTNLSGDIRGIPPEGALMPETYRVPRGATRQSVIDMMVAEQSKLIESLWASRQQGLPLQSVQDALILASIVERETGRNDKHADIASVFINRLRKSMPLQSDPTILYGLYGGTVNWGKPITRSEIQSRTAHNTYVIKALPPTPICNPSKTSLQAVLNPTVSNYLYFVASGNGSSVFSETLDQHNVAVANWRKVEQAIRAKQAEQGAVQPAPAVAPAATQQRAVSRPAPAPVAATPDPAAAVPSSTVIPNVLNANAGATSPPADQKAAKGTKTARDPKLTPVR